MAKKKNKKSKPKKMFIDGLDSYSNEYGRWKMTDVVRRLLGVHELSDEHFYLESIEEKLDVVGHGGLTVLYFQTGHEKAASPDKGSVGTGCACAIKDPYGKVRPIVFVRSSVETTGDATDEVQTSVSDAIRLLVLIHELGHADDISRGINFDHTALTLNHVGAEAYAHSFVIQQAKRMNYRLALEYYLDNLKLWAESDDEVVRLAAEQIISGHDVAELKKWAVVPKTDGPFKRMVERSGRMDEVLRKDRK